MKLLWELLMVSWSCFGTEERRKEEITLGRPPEELRKPPRRRSGAGSDEWKPSLCSISEDRVVRAPQPSGIGTGGGERRAVAVKPGPGRAIRKSGGSGSRARVHVRGSSDDIGGASITIAIPAFSPTPFMF